VFDDSNNSPRLDNVMDTSFKTEITFFERASYQYPTPGSVALVTGNSSSQKELLSQRSESLLSQLECMFTTVASASDISVTENDI
jgi:hypothetical protein